MWHEIFGMKWPLESSPQKKGVPFLMDGDDEAELPHRRYSDEWECLEEDANESGRKRTHTHSI